MIPKFRAWDKDKEWMVYDVQDTYDGLWSERNSDEVNDYYGYASTFQSFTDEEDFNFMQYTGLKDKNGVEIYEGDVINAENDMWSEYQTDPIVEGGVVFESGAFVVSDKYSGEKFTFWVLEKIKVIGNIHKNPELLEVAE